MEYLLLSIFLIAIVSICIGVKVGIKSEFDKVVALFLVFVSVHVLCKFVYSFFNPIGFIGVGFSFGLVYGPLFYLALRAANGNVVINKLVVLHFLPFALQLILAVILQTSPNILGELRVAYYQTSYQLMAFSMIGYLIVAWIFRRGQAAIRGRANRLIAIWITILATMGLIFFVLILFPMTIEDMVGIQFPRYLIYGSIFILTCAVLYYELSCMTEDEVVIDKGEVVFNEVAAPTYGKSLISDSAMDTYECKLQKLIENQVFKDVDLSLEGLAKQIGAPKHHLTQLLNLRFKKTFNQYINTLRVEYACELLKQKSTEYSIEELAYECGFNSKASFNRNFKNIVSLTPSEYRVRQNE